MKAPELEAALVGTLLGAREPAKLLEASGLTPDDFTDRNLAIVWDLVRRQLEHSRPVSPVVVFAAGVAAKSLSADDIGWLQTLQLRHALATDSFLATAAEVRREARRRQVSTRLRALSDELRNKDMEPAKIWAALEEQQQLLRRDYAQNRTGEAEVAELLGEWDRRIAAGKPLRCPTAIPVIDEHLGGWDANLNLLIGAPGSLKSGFLATVIEAQLKAGMRVGLFGLEDGTAWLTRRLVAKRLGIPLRDIGNRKRTEAEEDLIDQAGPELTGLMRNLLVYRQGSITPAELCRWSSSWIMNHGCQCIYVDNATELDYGGGGGDDDKHRLAVAGAFRRVRDLAVRHEVPIVVLAHTTRKYDERTGGEKPPHPSDAAESAALERRARKMLGTWRKGSAFRISVLKSNEGESRLTFEFDRLVEQGLLDPEKGRLVNLQEESREERQAKAAREDENAVAKRLRRAELTARHAAAKRASEPPKEPEPDAPQEPAPQLELLPEVKP